MNTVNETAGCTVCGARLRPGPIQTGTCDAVCWRANASGRSRPQQICADIASEEEQDAQQLNEEMRMDEVARILREDSNYNSPEFQ